MKPLDTTPEADDLQMSIHRRMGGGARAQLALEMSLIAREFTFSRLKRENPSLQETEIARFYVANVLQVGPPYRGIT